MTALSTIRWTEDNYTPNEVIRIANGFPKLIQVERGCEGDTPLETVDAGQVYHHLYIITMELNILKAIYLQRIFVFLRISPLNTLII